MRKRSFTDRWLASVGPFEDTTEFTDGACANLRMRVGRRSKSFSVMIGSAQARRRIALGSYPAVSLVEARKKATEILADPRAAGGGRPRRGGRSRTGTVKELFRFVVDAMEQEGKLASIKDYRLYLLDSADAAVKDFGPSTPARNVTAQMATDWLAKFHERGKSTRLPRAILSAAFNRGIKADNDPTAKKDRKILFSLGGNPVSTVGGPTQSNTRERSLTSEELAAFWRELSGDTFVRPVGVALRLLIAMGGVRVTEVINSRKDWWQDDGRWRSLDAARLALPKTKNGHPHDLPVTRSAMSLLQEARILAPARSIHLFPSPYEPSAPRSMDNYARAVAQFCESTQFEPFTPRDIRRSMKNLLLEDDVPPTEVDIWHNHGRNADVARRNYDRAQYEHAKGRVRDAIDRLIDRF